MISAKIIPFREQNPEAIVFDLGGVLLKLDVRKTIDAFISLGFENVEEKMARILTKKPETDDAGLFRLYETGQITSEQFREGIRMHTGKDISDEKIDRAWTSMLLEIPENNISLIEKLSESYRIYLLSNTNDIHIEHMLAHSGSLRGFGSLVNHFDKLYYSHMVKMRKPDAEIYRHVIEDAGINPQKSLFIDDSPANIEGATAAGFLTYHHPANSSLEPYFNPA